MEQQAHCNRLTVGWFIHLTLKQRIDAQFLSRKILISIVIGSYETECSVSPLLLFIHPPLR